MLVYPRRHALIALLAAGCAAPATGGGSKSESSTAPTTTFSGPNGPYTAPYGTTFPETTPAVPTGDGDADGVDAPIDCDDSDPTSAPGMPEIACDGRDNDCAGDGDERAGCDLPAESADLVLTLPTDLAVETGWGGLRVERDSNGDGLLDLWVQGAGDGEGLQVAYTLPARAPVDPFVVVTNGDVMFPGDVDGDGVDDVWAGDFHATPLSGTVDAAPLSYFSDDMAIADDWSGDGAQELLIYAEGDLYWFSSPPPEDATVYDSNSYVYAADVTGSGPPAFLDQVDLDGDGLLEFVMGSYAANDSFAEYGRFLIVVGGTPTVGDWPTEILEVGFGQAMTVGDVNGDGQVDVVSSSEDVRVVYGPIIGEALDRFTYPEVSTGHTDAEGSVEIVPDFDGDGRNEVLFTCSDRVVLGEFGTPGYVPDPCIAGRTFLTEETNVSGVNHFFAGGDLDGDGYGDVAILDVTTDVVRVWFGHPW